ncbi:MAG: type VI secretion system baseplate subunit TssE [Limnobacter sp.]|jgi:type VI secretion system protein ImpF|uniref:type VI secretion system baseplate subunit TssE n=1 Tax=Limnobacter sp. TaxID=2003368 RepID=UPI002732E663|nr:type VI secretion system baseplate subunit TssE [Limnobacter sp.]MDP3187873.1 type VI secretion system baseplate subunit TssE [Limnobacter sp.]
MSKSRDALQPALLDRLQDDEPARQTESSNSRFITKEALRHMVLRDLEQLLNATRVIESKHLQQQPQLLNSVLAYGMPPVAGKIASMIDVKDFERTVADLIRRFEPRIDGQSLKVQAETQQGLMHLHNVIGLRISGLLWAQPYPIELMLRTEVDLETGKVLLMPLSGF